ncbi:hypothetical protein IWZ03DRAFT_107683 [Phyllosticta citriasiana]|uniref:Uncharacterized protein n=1 Tax=Phyllosticta citriasiana TaxID=595635 RepID=A0ABR1KV12_9PEZI
MPLELLSFGLECFQSRQTDQRTRGGMAYALMALLRGRPKVNKNDSAFEAFARLSLANDSGRLLERMICMLPPKPNAEWFHIRDKWSARLWDIGPIAQVGEILDNETVSLDGAYGATIEWDAMKPPALFKRKTLARKYAKVLLHGLLIYLLSGLAFTIMGAILMRALEHSGNGDTLGSGNLFGSGNVFAKQSALRWEMAVSSPRQCSSCLSLSWSLGPSKWLGLSPSCLLPQQCFSTFIGASSTQHRPEFWALKDASTWVSQRVICLASVRTGSSWTRMGAASISMTLAGQSEMLLSFPTVV